MVQMAGKVVLDLKTQVRDGTLFHPPDDEYRTDSYIPPMGNENHAPGLASLPNGDLLCVWFAGSAEGASDISIAMSRLPAEDNRWTEPTWLTSDPARAEQNPSLFVTPQGDLWLLFTSQQTRDISREEWDRQKAAGKVEGIYPMQWTSEVRRRVSTDGGWSWGEVETFVDKPGSFCRHPPTVLRNGDWLFPMYYSLQEGTLHGNDYSVVRISEDEGQSWREHPVPNSKGRVHPSVVELEEGRLVAFFRSRAADRIYVSRSSDYGQTWSPAERSMLPNNNASIHATKLASGNIAIIFNYFSANDDPDKVLWPTRRYPLTIAISEDEGRTWPYMRHVDPGDNFFGEENERLNRVCAYPCFDRTQDEAIHLAYSYRGRQCIKYVRVTEEWVRDQLDYVYDRHVSHAHPF
jgi:predicted neuraminidase